MTGSRTRSIFGRRFTTRNTGGCSERTDGIVDNGGTGSARGAEVFLKRKTAKFEILFVYNFLNSKRKENDVPVLVPSLGDRPFHHGDLHLETQARVAWNPLFARFGPALHSAAGKGMGMRKPKALRPFGAPPSVIGIPLIERVDLNGSLQFDAFHRLIIVYFGITNLLNNANISRYDYG